MVASAVMPQPRVMTAPTKKTSKERTPGGIEYEIGANVTMTSRMKKKAYAAMIGRSPWKLTDQQYSAEEHSGP